MSAGTSCPECLQLLEKYADEAAAIARHWKAKADTAVLASVHVLALDAGTAARKHMDDHRAEPQGWLGPWPHLFGHSAARAAEKRRVESGAQA